MRSFHLQGRKRYVICSLFDEKKFDQVHQGMLVAFYGKLYTRDFIPAVTVRRIEELDEDLHVRHA
jgi:hypothetical protein